MHRFFAEIPDVAEHKIRITGEDVNHIRNVLRMEPGEKICVVSGQDHREYYCEIVKMDSEEVEARIYETRESDCEPGSRIVLFQGLPKGDKMEWIIQKSVELGVHTVVPVAMGRCVVKLDAKKAENKRKRWMKISESAAKQSGRARIPEVTGVVSFPEALEMAKELDVKILPYELASGMQVTRNLLGTIPRGASVGVFIGPEGGFEGSEVEAAEKTGVVPITLGKRILRTETAGLATLAMLVYNLEE